MYTKPTLKRYGTFREVTLQGMNFCQIFPGWDVYDWQCGGATSENQGGESNDRS